MTIEELEGSLKGCTHASVKDIAAEHFTPDFLQSHSHRLMSIIRMAQGIGMPITYQPTELDKCIVHYCVRGMGEDLWDATMPVIGPLITQEGRFNLDEAVSIGRFRQPSRELGQNLEYGREFIVESSREIYSEWLQDLQRRNAQKAPADVVPLQYTVYKLHSMLIGDMDWGAPTIMQRTFLSAAQEDFLWLKDYPDFTRGQLESIVANSTKSPIAQATQLGIYSAAKEEVVSDVAERGGHPYIYDSESNQIIFNPRYQQQVEDAVEERRPTYYDQTKLKLSCPIVHVPSDLYPTGGMLHDLIRFKFSVYVEAYLAAHNRR